MALTRYRFRSGICDRCRHRVVVAEKTDLETGEIVLAAAWERKCPFCSCFVDLVEVPTSEHMCGL